MTERGVLGATTKQLRIPDEGCPRAVNGDPMVSGSLPGGCDRRSQIGRQGSALDELLPCGSHFPLVHFGTSNVTKPDSRRRRAQRSITHWGFCLPPCSSISHKAQPLLSRAFRRSHREGWKIY